MTFPSSLDDLSIGRGQPGDKLSSPDHTQHHVDEDTAIEALETKVGIDSSSDPDSIDYQLKNTASIDPGHKHTVSSVDIALNDLNDVNASSPADGNGLVFNAATGKWVPAPTSVADASDTIIGVVKLSVAPASPTAPIAVGTNDPRFNTSSGTTLDGSSDKLVDTADVDAAATANKVARRNSNGDVTVPTTPTSSTDAASKSYVDLGNSFIAGSITPILATGTANNDTSVTTTFTPRLIRLNYWIQGHTQNGGSNTYVAEKGTAVFNATTLLFVKRDWFTAIGSDNTAPNASFTTNLSFDISPDSTTSPTSGNTHPSNGGGITVTLSIASVSATSFVIRCATAIQAANSNNARAAVSYEAFA